MEQELKKEIARLESQAPARQELMPCVNGDHQSLQIAMQGAKVGNAPIEELKEALRYAMVKVGVRAKNLPTDEEKGLLLAHIVQNYGGRTASEIRLAFDMAIGGKLNLEPSEVVCYENFSCLYFSTILNSYQRWAAEEYEQLPQVAFPESKVDPLTDKTYEDWMDYVRDRVKSLKCSVEFIPVPIYDWMDSKGQITLTKEQKWEYFKRAIEYRQGQLSELAEKGSMGDRDNLKRFMEMKKEEKFSGEFTDQLRNMAKKMILFDLMIK